MSEKHPLLVELEKWEDRLYENEPPCPEDLFDETVNEATRQARQQAYTAKTEAAMKDALEEYKKWWADNAEALAQWIDSGEQNEGPLLTSLLSWTGRLICISVEYAKAFYTAATVDTKATVFALLASGSLAGKDWIETARVKAETIISEEIHIELLELLELYCELLIARFGILDLNSREPDPAISEELHVLRDILMHKYGREFSIAVMENHDGRVVRKLDIAMPSSELVNAYLAEIAKAYGVSWMSPNAPSSDDNIDEGSDGDVKQTAASTNSPPAYRPNAAAEPGPTLPAIPPGDIDGPDNKKSKSEDAITSVSKAQSATTETPEDEFEALNRRFAALKKK
ncbi:hypothetical protein ARMGADRAFT_1024379 [Armillaria gallica]|uniref:Uncharacterized protein n=1 Tax=Armillaria gallica TaxID=47427 RepID=A0A2H3E2K9_ARMGA|nr:hypothetical protein ARMGADRAFT_1024379 [Armillaria gallica]